MSLLAQIAIFLAAAVIAIPIFRRFKLGAVLGYLTAGIIIGPASLGLISTVDTAQNIAQFGIVLLMFVIGLELQPSRLWVLRKSILGLGTGQVAATTLCLGAAAFYVFAQSWQSALVIGFALSMSSTALALQLLAERGQLNSQFGRASFSILLFQDVSVMPVLALLPLLGVNAAKTADSGGWLVIKLIAVLAAVIIGGRYVLRPMLRIIAATRVAEAFTAAGLLIVLGTALLVSQVGLSLSLGAFLAGVLLADSEFRHELEADIEPFKGLLLGLFFMSVGMSANLGLVRERPLLIIGLTIGFMVLKILILWIIGRLSGLSPVASRGLAISLPSGGEFAFVLLGLAASFGIMGTGTAELLVLVVTASMILSPVLLSLYEVTFKAPEAPGRPFDTPAEIYPKVLIAGFGRFGQIIGRILLAPQYRLHGTRGQSDPGGFPAAFRQPGVLRGRIPPGAVAGGTCRERRDFRARHRRRRGIGADGGNDPQAFSASENLRAGPQPSARFPIDGLGRALPDPRDPGSEPGDVIAGAGGARSAEIEGRPNGAALPRAR